MAGPLAGALALACIAAPAASEEIWGYVDANRIPHFATSKLDQRYELLHRDSDAPPPEPYRLTGRKGRAAVPNTASSAATSYTASYAPSMSPKMATFFERSKTYKAVSPLLREAARTHGIDYALLKAVISTESGFNPHAVSPKGAVGLMQLIPPTAARYGVTASPGSTIEKRLTDPKTNIKAGARYLAYLIKLFPGQLELALAAYNAGEGAVQRAGNKIPNYPETRKYVKNVMQLYGGLGATAPAKSSSASRGAAPAASETR